MNQAVFGSNGLNNPVFFNRHPMARHNPILSRTSTGGTLDDAKAFLDKESLGIAGVKNSYVLAAAVVAGVGYYGYTQGWFR